MRLLDGGWGVTTTGPDATPPPTICQNCGAGGGRGGWGGRMGGGSAGGWGGGLEAWSGGGLRAAHYYHMHTSRGCVCVWGHGGIEVCMR